MIEIVALIATCVYLGKMLRAKGHKPLGYQVGVVATYYGGCFLGGFIYGMISASQGVQVLEFSPMLFLVVFAFGVIPASLVVVAAKMKAPAPTAQNEVPVAELSNQPTNPVPPPISANPYASPTSST